MERTRSLTAPYAAVQAIFWMSYCVAVGFAAVYLQALGYTNVQLGAILAAGSTLGALLGTGLSARIDADARLSASRLLPPALGAQAAALLALLLVPRLGIVTTAAFTLFVAFCLALNSLLLKLYIDAEHAGRELRFSTARGIGSLGYVMLSALLGVLVSRSSVRVLPLAGLIPCALQLVFCRRIARALPSADVQGAERTAAGTPITAFARRYPRFCIVLLGSVLIFFAHSTLNSFLINITRAAGGDTETMGYRNAFIAAVEIPVMLLFHRLRGRHSSASYLRLAYVAFLFKTLAVTFAPNVPALFAAFALQAPAFALYASVSVDYADEAVPYEASAKAQSLSFSATTVGSVFASIVSGWLLDTISVRQTLLVSCAVCLIGLAVVLFGLCGKK